MSKKITSILMTVLVIIILIVAIVSTSILVIQNVFKPADPTISSSYIVQKLSSSSELTTAKLKLLGRSSYDSKGIPVINNDAFSMTYYATVRAGIDMKDIKVDVNNATQTVYIQIPQAKILDVKIDPDSIEYYNESFSFFKSDSKQNTAKAQSMAEKQMKKEAKNSGIIELANKQSKTLIKGILQDVVNNYKIEFETLEETTTATQTEATTTK